MDDFYIDKKFSVNANIGSCWNCNRYSNLMWTTNTCLLKDRSFRCRKCAFGTDVIKIHSTFVGPYSQDCKSYDCKDLSWEKPGNFFKCPLGICSRENLSFEEFYSQSCCGNKTKHVELKEYNDAEKIDHDYIADILKVHKKLRGLQIEAKTKYDRVKKLLDEAQEELENSEENLKNVEDKMALCFVRTATAITEGKPLEEDSRLLCKICCEKYNETDRTQCVLPCRHSSCEKCLTALPSKTCPVCREPFTADQIMKLFN